MKKIYATCSSDVTIPPKFFEDKKLAKQYIKDHNEQTPKNPLILEELITSNNKNGFQYKKYRYLQLECTFGRDGELIFTKYDEVSTNNIDTPLKDINKIHYSSNSFFSFSRNSEKNSSYIQRKIIVKEVLENEKDIVLIKEKMKECCRELYKQATSYNKSVQDDEVEKQLNRLTYKLKSTKNKSFPSSLEIFISNNKYKEFLNEHLEQI